jgi:hypothetical protein
MAVGRRLNAYFYCCELIFYLFIYLYNGKIEKFGRLLLLPIYWYPSDDEEDKEVSLTEFN